MRLESNDRATALAACYDILQRAAARARSETTVVLVVIDLARLRPSRGSVQTTGQVKVYRVVSSLPRPRTCRLVRACAEGM